MKKTKKKLQGFPSLWISSTGLQLCLMLETDDHQSLIYIPAASGTLVVPLKRLVVLPLRLHSYFEEFRP